MQPDVVHIATAINRGYLPYFAVMVQSIISSRDMSREYCVHVVSSDVTLDDLDQMPFLNDDRFTVDLVDVNWFKGDVAELKFGEFFTVECIYRLALLDALPNVEKILYLDSDLVVLKDLSELYDIDLEHNYAAAVRDIGIAGMAGGYAPDETERLSKLGIDDFNNYFSSGVMVWDLRKTRSDFSLSQFVSWISENDPRYADQDCLNFFFKGSVLFLDMKWNTLFDSEGVRVSDIASFAPKEMQQEYLRARKEPAIFHYAGPIKPWAEDVDGSVLFWKIARESCLYEPVLRRYVNSENKRLFDMVWKTFDDVYFRLSEAERIRADLHRRLSITEDKLSELEGRVEELERLKTPVLNRIYNKLVARNGN